ncbi:DUF3558 domain-containing protein [Nocardia cyriacigeorgica]|uniref:DUF3558 domain-containing protein n=1 Tax=Nocardia cyriacigeorgica TaxID=135487 RepID=UPI0018932335|nr:DUF3558 domain-containing protein [Nocardia cyriacigeorgica]MBF6096663.1 DUF3558 domain-containing protein [Nocardia cyriacigeorgica]MBF6162470.1 DUF3558 domain-containing protein [Nocardia cyriacigeorgica]MBF6201546.1 DUF3558 domain-containing protein [Nocardia cyriacigeorgica]MBF6317037.1 DUF3558 domain-containing protein [Nocardia cyriacigeorgica]MBF6532411.1 DUF3558 domain-containing protein [Nocardia cyriacigeorgica]
MMCNKLRWVAVLATATAGLVGCSQDEQNSALPSSSVVAASSTVKASPPRPTLTNPKLQPPPQKNKYTTEGRPEVVVDPCTWFSDEAIAKAGLDPATRRRGSDWVAEYTFLTCDFDGPHRDLSVDSGNVTWAEDIEKNGPNSEPLTVNGREAMWVLDPDLQGTCDIHLRTKIGILILSAVRTHEGIQAGLGRCDGVLEMAEAIEPEIGKDN